MKVAIYCRLSEEDKNKKTEREYSESIQNQKSLLLQYPMEREWEVHQIHSDDDYTGADRNGPAFNQLLADAEEHKFCRFPPLFQSMLNQQCLIFVNMVLGF